MAAIGDVTRKRPRKSDLDIVTRRRRRQGGAGRTGTKAGRPRRR